MGFIEKITKIISRNCFELKDLVNIVIEFTYPKIGGFFSNDYHCYIIRKMTPKMVYVQRVLMNSRWSNRKLVGFWDKPTGDWRLRRLRGGRRGQNNYISFEVFGFFNNKMWYNKDLQTTT